jgi:hypothetical protein
MVNISWGTKIAILYISFAALIIVMVIMSMQQKIDLVSDDYYAKELVFQDKLNEMNNANSLPEKITHNITENTFILTFPAIFKNTSIIGNIEFYRPSDNSKDLKLPIQLSEKLEQSIGLKQLSKGMYKMNISWTANKTNYFTEETIVIP